MGSFGSFGDGALVVIEYEHFQIHKGNSFVAFQRTTLDGLDIASPLSFWFIPAISTYNPHVTVKVNVGAQAILEIFEDDGDPNHFDVTNGSAFIPVNRNRTSTKASTAFVITGPTITQATADCLIYAETLGNLIGGEYSREHEFIFKYGTSYLIRLSTFADNNEGSLVLNWYERIKGTY